MIRTLSQGDLDAAAQLWLEGNLQAHPFIPARYWQENLQPVRAMLAQAEVYVYEDQGILQGFIGLEGDYIAGLFVRQEARSRGIGTALVEYVRKDRQALSLHVYRDNPRAAAFYRRAGFSLQGEGTDAATGAAEYQMAWQRDA